jgi:hypothetical protein
MKLDWFEREAYHDGPATTDKQKQVIRLAKLKLALLKHRITQSIRRRIRK